MDERTQRWLDITIGFIEGRLNEKTGDEADRIELLEAWQKIQELFERVSRENEEARSESEQKGIKENE